MIPDHIKLALGASVNSYYLMNPQDGIRGELMRYVEKELMKIALDHAHNNQTAATHKLGLNRGTFRTRMKEYGL